MHHNVLAEVGMSYSLFVMFHVFPVMKRRENTAVRSKNHWLFKHFLGCEKSRTHLMRWKEREKGNVTVFVKRDHLGANLDFEFCVWGESTVDELPVTFYCSSLASSVFEICSLKCRTTNITFSRKQCWNIYFRWIPHSAMLQMMSLQTWQNKSATHACACFTTVYVVRNILLVTFSLCHRQVKINDQP